MVREGFCPVCIAAPIAIMAGGGAVKKSKESSSAMLYKCGGTGLIIFAVLLFLFERNMSGCAECAAGR